MCLCFLWAVILVAHFLQSVSSGLVLGGELVYHRGRAEEGGILTLAGQYSSEIFMFICKSAMKKYARNCVALQIYLLKKAC